jgi:hypothetical protein
MIHPRISFSYNCGLMDGIITNPDAARFPKHPYVFINGISIRLYRDYFALLNTNQVTKSDQELVIRLLNEAQCIASDSVNAQRIGSYIDDIRANHQSFQQQ